MLSKTHQLPFTLLEKLFKCYLSWSQGSVKSKPCRFFWRCPFSPLPAAAFLTSLKLALHHFDRCGTRQTPFCLVFSTSLLPMSHSTRLKAASRPSSIGWSFEDIKIGQLGERWSERRLVLLGSPLRDGQMDGWHVQTVASVSPLSWTQSCQKLCQTHVRQMGSLCSLGFCSVNPPPPTPPSAPSPFIAPS